MIRENIYSFIKEKNARLYVPKNGGLRWYVKKLLGEIGIQDGLEIILARGEDIPQRVADSISYGLTGDDLFDEYVARGNNELAVLNTYDWYDPEAKFLRPALCLMKGKGPVRQPPNIAVNKKYEMTSEKYVKQRFSAAKMTAYAGDTESTVAEGINDYCIDIVLSGKSCENAGLSIVEILRFSDISLIGRIGSSSYEYSRILKSKGSDSYTGKLLANRNEAIKKLGQESAELVDAFSQMCNVENEALDVIYAAMVMMASAGVTWQQIEAELKRRWLS